MNVLVVPFITMFLMHALCPSPVHALLSLQRWSRSSGTSRGQGLEPLLRRSLSGATRIETARRVQRLPHPSDPLQTVDVFIFDCDGVLWKGDSLIPGASQALQSLRTHGKRIFFVTNNSTKSRQGFLKKFTDLGITARQEEIFSSSFAAALYLTQKSPLNPGEKVYVIGTQGLCDELQRHNLSYLGGPQDDDKTVTLAPGGKVQHDPHVAAVVVGYDPAINYYKLQYAQLCMNSNPDCKFIATNLDPVAHITNEQEWAEAGAMVGAIEGCTHRPPIVVGKPSSLLIDYIVDHFHVKKDRIAMVGDRLDTDIVFGRDNGLRTVLTLSGVTSKEKLLSPLNDIHPDYYIDSIVDLMPR